MTTDTAQKSAQKRKSAADMPESSDEVLERLRVDSATAFDLYSQIKQAHWNVEGATFIALHELFDTQAAAVRAHVDTLAERLRILGGVPQGTVRQAAKLTELPDFPDKVVSADEAVRALVERYQQFSDRVKESARLAGEADDSATEDAYIEVLRSIDLQAWFLRSHLE